MPGIKGDEDEHPAKSNAEIYCQPSHILPFNVCTHKVI